MSRLLADERPQQFTTFITGQSIDLLNPDPELIFIEDIAGALAKINRFMGFTSRPYSVAEHCVLPLDLVPAWDRFEYLMHDASEAYLGDVSGPLKRWSGMAHYRDLEETWRLAIAKRFGLKKVTPGSVKVCDQRMLVTEMRDLRGRRPMWRDTVKPYALQIPALGPSAEMAERMFLEAFDHYSTATKGAKK